MISYGTLDEMYTLATLSSIGLSFRQSVETLESIAVGTLNILTRKLPRQGDTAFASAAPVSESVSAILATGAH